jgi:hypothetical protein
MLHHRILLGRKFLRKVITVKLVGSSAFHPVANDQVGHHYDRAFKFINLQTGIGQTAGPAAFAPGKDTPKERVGNDNLPGTGPYPAAWFTDDSLKAHTIYAPKSPPKDIKLPVLIWGNGGCGSSGLGFQNILREIASHGFIAIANGAPTGGFGQSKMTAMTESLDWVMAGAANGKFGNVDSSKIAAGGQR